MRKFNDWLAVKLTKGVGSMWCAYAFATLALYGLPAALKRGGEGPVAWTAQTFLQLVLLSVIIVGQDLTGRAASRQAQETHDAVMEELRLLHDKVDVVDNNHGHQLAEVLDAIHTPDPAPPTGGGN